MGTTIQAPAATEVSRPALPSVRFHIPSLNNVWGTELCIRSARRYAGYPLEITVGEGGSFDYSPRLLEDFQGRGWVSVERAQRSYGEWLDWWVQNCQEDYAVFAHSDMEFRRPNWLRDLVTAARENDAMVVYSEMVAESPGFVEPAGGHTVRLAGRPACWLFLVDVARVRAFGHSFQFHAEETTEYPEGRVAFDEGGAFFRELQRSDEKWHLMPRSFRRRYRHYGGLYKIHNFPASRRYYKQKLRDLSRVDRRVRRHRRAQDA